MADKVIDIVHDDVHAITTINGIRYADVMFESLAFSPVGTFMRIESRLDGTITVRRFSKDLEDKFLSAANLPRV